MAEQVCQDRIAKKKLSGKTARKGLLGHGCQDRAAKKGLQRENCLEETAMAGKPEWDRPNKTAMIRWLGQDSQDQAGKIGLPAQDC